MTAPAASPWTPERINKLRQMWADGFSTPYIAGMLGGGITHNSVIGKAQRLGLGVHASCYKRDADAARPAHKRRAQRRKPSLATIPASVAGSAAPEPSVAVIEPLPRELQADTRVMIDGLRFPIVQCRWIDGEPAAGALYCGAKTKIGTSYCPEHEARCWSSYKRRAA